MQPTRRSFLKGLGVALSIPVLGFKGKAEADHQEIVDELQADQPKVYTSRTGGASGPVFGSSKALASAATVYLDGDICYATDSARLMTFIDGQWIDLNSGSNVLRSRTFNSGPK